MNCGNLWTAKILPYLRLSVGDVIELPGYINNPYTVTEEGMNDCNGEHAAAPSLALINGVASFEKLPWKPKENEVYYFFMPNGVAVSVYHPCIYITDLMASATGNYGRTEEELRQKEPAILNVLG